ncbi:LOW QUALITY PROTEIN: nipped-B-like protein A [Daphnia pulex]|uniref:LOW QUALITY PROTEIN: nipped-B-like protein A n=1 Tax=Daphnia pulex TaxID=6669 RepID=UPI001EDC93E0|nr:LOW QUALITY PROTEIN: nipped-B-like protein A [Daphnia pulex]
MNGEIPTIPIISLAGIASLSDLLPEMPLPVPLASTQASRSLFFHPRVAEEAHSLLSTHDDALAAQLQHALTTTSYNPQHIILRDQRYENFNHPELSQPQPELLSAILLRNPHVFRQQQQQQHPQPWNSNQSTVHPHQQQQQQFVYNSQQQIGYASPATHVGAYTPSGNSVQGYAPQQSPAPGLPAQAAMNYVPQGSPYSTQTKLLAAQNNVYPQQPQQENYNSPSWGYEKPVHTPVPAQQHCQQQQSQQHYPQHLPQQPQPTHPAMPLVEPQQPQQYNQQQQIHPQQIQEQPPTQHPVPQQAAQPHLPVYNHQEFPNAITSTRSHERKETDKSTFQPQPIVPQQTANSQPFTASVKVDPIALSSMNNSSQQNNRMSRNHSSGRPSYKEDSDSDGGGRGKGSVVVKPVEPVKEQKPIVEESKPKVKVRKEDKDRETPRKRKSTGGEVTTPNNDEVAPAPKKKLKRLERKVVHDEGKLNAEELMETNTFQRFTRLVEHIFDATEDADLNAPADLDNDTDIPQEAMIPKQQLHDLCAEAAKLKSMGAMSAVPPERLVRLLNLLEKNIRDGAKISLLGDPDEDEEESKLWTELSSERVLRAVEAALAALHILTAPNMPKRAYLEEVIERIVQLARFQLQHSIYPAYDPVYRTESKKDVTISGGSSKKKRAHVREVRDKTVLLVYHKMVGLVGLMAELLAVQTLTDTAVLHLSTVGVAPFFVENIPELQLSTLRLVTTIFSRYEKHRRLLLDDILASIARLPSSKRGLRTFRLSAEQHIQMLTALVLQLIQCVLCLPEKLGAPPGTTVSAEDVDSSVLAMDPEVVVNTRYDTAVRTAANFLSVFLGKCGDKNNEEVDYRPLFENFVQDLLSTVNKPEWPAAELLLSLLGKLLVQNFSNKNVDVLLQVASLEYLGVVAARLRKDAVSSQLKTDTIDQLLKQVREDEANNAVEEFKSKKHKKKKKSGDKDHEKENIPADKIEVPQSLLLDYLAVNSQCDPAMLHARHFYVAQWYMDIKNSVTKRSVSSENIPETGVEERPRIKETPKKKKKKKKRNHFSSSESSSSSSSSEDEDDNAKKPEQENTAADCNDHNQSLEMADRRKKLLLSKINPFPEAAPGTRTQVLTTPLDAESSELITRFLASKRQFSQSFDSYLKHILKVLTEPAIAVRAKAMKCLTQIVESDPVVLARSDMQLGVHHSFLDQSTAVTPVREAAVDLVGKFVLSRPELIDKYYTMLSARILDTGVSVRKRVIKIMKDICTECPDFTKIPEICVKMIRRVNDEEGGIKKLVMEVFQAMWFSPVRDKPTLDFNALMRKVMNITDVVAACRDTGLDWLEQLLQQMFRPKEDKEDVTKANVEPSKALLMAYQKIVDCLVENILRLEEASLARGPSSAGSADGKNSNGGETKGASQRLVACMTTLYLFAKIRPLLLVPHAMTLQPYLSLRCRTQGDYQIISDVARTLEVVVPLLEHPSESFLAQLEEDAVKLILQHEKAVVAACLSCLGSVVNHVTRNFKLIRDCFRKYFGPLTEYKLMHERDPDNPRLVQHRPFFRRALFTVGLLLRHFDFTDEEVRYGLPDSTKQQVMEILLYFVCQNCTDMQFFTLQAIGSVCIRHYDFMLGESLKSVYLNRLLEPSVALRLKVQVLNNIETYLQEEEIRMIKEDQQWSKTSKKENLKEMGDVTSGMASTVIQLYLKPILDCFFHGASSVRQSAFRVTQLILQQGLVHPVQIVPYLICISTDAERVSHAADKQLQEIEKKYPGFIHMKALQGIRLSYQLQSLIESAPKENSPVQSASKSTPETPNKKIGTKCSVASAIQESQGIARGFRLREGEHPSALNGFLYSLLRGTKQQRRALVLSMLKQFDETSKNPLAQLLYLADNLASFPYQVIDEPLFLIHHIDIMVSVTGSNLLQGFRESLLPSAVPTSPEEEEDDEDIASIMQRLPPDTRPFEEFLTAAQGCLLLLMLKQHLKDQYGLTDAKITQYSPSEGAKIYEKNAPRKLVNIFMPRPTLHALKENLGLGGYLEVSSKQSLVEKYIEFKQLMLKIDPAEEDEEERLASAMRTYQVTESPVPTDVPAMGVPIFGAAPPIIPGVALMGAPSTPMKTPRSKSSKTPRSPRGERPRDQETIFLKRV